MNKSRLKSKLHRGLALTQQESWELYKYIKALEEQRWIPFNKQEPPAGEYLVTWRWRDSIGMDIAEYSILPDEYQDVVDYDCFDAEVLSDYGEWTFDREYDWMKAKEAIEVLAWMPLPESYKIPAQTFGCAED